MAWHIEVLDGRAVVRMNTNKVNVHKPSSGNVCYDFSEHFDTRPPLRAATRYRIDSLVSCCRATTTGRPEQSWRDALVLGSTGGPPPQCLIRGSRIAQR